MKEMLPKGAELPCPPYLRALSGERLPEEKEPSPLPLVWDGGGLLNPPVPSNFSLMAETTSFQERAGDVAVSLEEGRTEEKCTGGGPPVGRGI